MERKISEYKIDEENKRMLQDAINRVMYICQINKIPAFVSVAIENSNEGTDYHNEVYSSASNYVNLKDDRIRKYMLIANGYEVVPPREVVDFDIDELFPKQS